MTRATTWPGLTTAINAMIDSGKWASLSDAGRAVWLVLAKRADNATGRCWPSINSIARDSGKGRTQTYAAIRELETCGLIQREETTGGAPTNTATCTMLIPVRPAEPVRPTEPLPVRPAGQTRSASRTRIPHESPIKSIADAGASGEGKHNGRGQGRKPRQRDEVFEAVAEVCGLPLDGLTKSSRGQLNKAAAELREVETDPMEIRQRAATYAETYPTAKLTPTALVKHWPALAGDGTTAGGLTTEWRSPSDDELADVLGDGKGEQ